MEIIQYFKFRLFLYDYKKTKKTISLNSLNITLVHYLVIYYFSGLLL